MIEIQAKLLRGPVYFPNETIQCLITLRNVPRYENGLPNGTINSGNNNLKSSETIERICWANVQLHCFCSVDESQIDCRQIINANVDSQLINHNGFIKNKRNSIALETFTSNDTSFHECLIRAERGIIIYASKPKILFCDLQLEPHQSQTFIYTETLPSNLNPSYSSSKLKYYYKLSIGAQRIGSPIYLLKIPIRILVVDEFQTEKKEQSSNGYETNGEDDAKSCASTNTSFTFDDESKDYGTSLDAALHRIEYLAGHRVQHSFNITSGFGKVAKFFIYKTVYRLGEDIIGLFDFTEGSVKCVRYSVTLQSQEKISNVFNGSMNGNKSNRDFKTESSNYTRCQEFCLHMNHSPMNLTIPFTITPTFSNDLVSLQWILHFSFVIQNHQQPSTSMVDVRNECEDAVQTFAPRNLSVQVMTWDFPIKIVATYPAHVAKGFQMASIGTLNI